MTNYSEEQIAKMKQIGNSWLGRSKKGEMIHRIYFNDLALRLIRAWGCDFRWHGSTPLIYQWSDGRKFVDADAEKFDNSLPEKLYFDLVSKCFRWEGGTREGAVNIHNTIMGDVERMQP